MKRTLLVRSAFARITPDSARASVTVKHKPSEPKPPKGPRAKKCKTCRQSFVPRSPMARACSLPCAMLLVAAEKLIVDRKAKRAARAATKAKLEAIKPRAKWIREAQTAFNAAMRARDAEQPCISCGKPPGDLSALHAGRDAGHYRSVGSAPHLRFNEDNCHAQCVKCNQFGSGRAVDYRIGLIARIGLSAVEALEAENTPRKYTITELIAIKAEYRAKLKALKQGATASDSPSPAAANHNSMENQ